MSFSERVAMAHSGPTRRRQFKVDLPERLSERVPVRVIYNPVSGGMTHEPKELRTLLEGLDPEFVVTRGEDDAREAAGEWRSGLLVAAGGDGTVNEAILGLGENGFPTDVTLAVLPMGTGNDLAQTLCIPQDPEKAVEIIRQEQVRVLDAAASTRSLQGSCSLSTWRPADSGWRSHKPPTTRN
jgi:diacylglycerol kinase (ATP)